MRSHEYFEEEEKAALDNADAGERDIYQAAVLMETFDSTFVHCGYRWVWYNNNMIL